ncbi:mannose-6-phosphate isomerase, class I [Paeniglutamicibacter antarcticus]|uniref:mannose-6-phosphate isomerase n=1 Tax=Arthrobacter terrae TaxID=2935737 RepID=A0A931G401_9MICC|nr:mannose-6-phosphate isomerase, class I [Arthrobacter terrae]MBG0738283.1 mannose-6-phosphate isomerase, class I [Arthrobacter terrae]
MYTLTNVLRPYAWGSRTAISTLLGRAPSGGPEAELWLGAHPGSPSLATAPDCSTGSLDELIADDPDGMLGTDVRAEFGDRLPFLAKILAASQPLSLQVHPTLAQAQAAFAREEAAGIPQAAAERNYKDNNHKPELILALTDFEALCGFRPATESRAIFERLSALFETAEETFPQLLRDVISDLSAVEESEAGESTAIRTAFHRLITGGNEVTDAVSAVVTVLNAGPAAHPPHTAYQRELSTVVNLDSNYPGDAGVLLSLLLNRVSLRPGEAIYLPPGNIHAYLEGLGVEVMASSDNVLRGGLTPKHVDVPELMKTVEFRALPVPLIAAGSTELGQEIWQPPFREFQLQRAILEPDGPPIPLDQNGPLLVIAVTGSVILDSPRGDLILAHGDSAFVPARESPVNAHPVSGADAAAVLYAVTVPAAVVPPAEPAPTRQR